MRDEAGAIPEEHLLEILLRDAHAGTLICTPDRLEDLALGWAWSHGLVERLPVAVRLEPHEGRSRAVIDAAPAASARWLEAAISGFDARTVIASVRAVVPEGAGMRRAVFQEQVAVVFDAFRGIRGAGGYHHAALFDERGIACLVADLSRHNAVDKVVGEALRTGFPAAGAAIALSGRVSSDIVIKAARLGVPVLTTRSLPTREAVELASEAGLTLVCRVLDQRRMELGARRLLDD